MRAKRIYLNIGGLKHEIQLRNVTKFNASLLWRRSSTSYVDRERGPMATTVAGDIGLVGRSSMPRH
ncbi:unnamed protein product, partial [Closterium sp. NIES-54]